MTLALGLAARTSATKIVPITSRTTFASAELFDPASGTFSATGSVHTARVTFTATLPADGQVLAAGGDTGSFQITPTSAAELHTP